jgi:putative ABC transport system ATP-binding protein
MGVEVRLEKVRHEYGRTEESAAVRALQDVTLTITEGDFVILKGPSGSGKSTLLNLIGAVDRPTSGRVFLGQREISSLSERELTLLRRSDIGFVFQFFNLIPTLRVHENIAFPLALLRVSAAEQKARVAEVLDEVGLRHRASHFPNELSGGEMQRVAIARAVVHRPILLLADEPTGNLDSHTGESVLELVRQVHETYRPTIIMATHSDRAAGYGRSIVELMDGAVVRSAFRGQRSAPETENAERGTRNVER